MTPATSDDRSLVGRLADEMTDRWKAGERPPTEVFLDRHPDLWQRPDAVLELVAEELALRDEFGSPATEAELVSRFPRWAAKVLALRDCHFAIAPRVKAVRFPDPGDVLDDFRLIRELGRGGHGRVFLAAQITLGDRPVVLKLAPDDSREGRSLARLQHTHIVPLYSAHDFPDRGLRGLCLPYFGGTTLAAHPAAAGPGGADGVCRIGAFLADALDYAHERGLLHLDVKPTNVLIAADGTPMLLDFHLARPPIPAGDPAPGRVGGTPGYMAPELAAAVRAVRAGDPPPEAVDRRADVFALGVTLIQRLDGVRVSAGLSDVLARCTAPAAADRYPSAAAVGADLRRHLAARPLTGVPNRSLTERWQKWRRRRPHTLAYTLVAAAFGLAAGGVAIQAATQAGRAEAGLAAGEAHLAEGRFAEAAEALAGADAARPGVPVRSGLGDRIRDARRRADLALSAAELHRFADRVRPLYNAEELPPEQARAAEAHCRDVWAKRHELVHRFGGRPHERPGEPTRVDLLDVGIVYAHLQSRGVTPGQAVDAGRRALATLDEAEELFGRSRVLQLERATIRGAGQRAALDGRGDEIPPVSPWDHLAVGRAKLGAGADGDALVELDRCLEHDPGSLWANYYRGACLLRLKRPLDALEAFSVCVALMPESAWCLYNRAVAATQAGQTARARRDFDRALALDPTLPRPTH